MRQAYPNAVTNGRRSRSGKILCDNWDTLKTLWGGSHVATFIRKPITSLEQKEDREEDNTSDEASTEFREHFL